MNARKICILLLLLLLAKVVSAQITLSGRVVSDANGRPVEFASILITESGLWAVTDAQGQFTIKDVGEGKMTLTVQCLGFQKRTWPMTISKSVNNLTLKLKEDNLLLDEVTVTAKRKSDESTTSYTIDRTALDNQQILNLGDIQTLLPGGKSVNPTLMSDERMALRSGTQEKGNASFGTAVEVDGMRLDNNATVGETAGVSTRSVSTSNIESVEIVTGIPSVEYGDLSNGVVKVNTRKGKSPYIIEGKLTQHTRQIALNKGFNLGTRHGVLNASLEHARSFSDAASPHTAYQRNVLSLHYMNVFMQQTSPLTLNIGLAGNVGGYNTEADPDRELDDYTKVRDNTLRIHTELNWLLNKSWITNVSMRAALSASDHRTENYQSENSATTMAYNHSREEGYLMATEYDSDPQAPIILGPTGYWHVKSFIDSKPLNWSLRLKGHWTHRFHSVLSRLMAGVEYTGSRNNGRGLYYDDMRYAPDWREYRYDELPTLHNLALYVEEKVSIPTTRRSTLELTAGLRDDITMIKGSDYGTVGSLSPRFNGRYIFWKNRRSRWVSALSVHTGWGKSVKLPSFQVLYPSPAYYSINVFNAPSDAGNKTVSAYYTRPLQTQYNPDLKWQYTRQTDVGVEMDVKGVHVSLSAFHHRTCRPYMSVRNYTPIQYQYTTVSHLVNAMTQVPIAPADRLYTIDCATGQVNVGSRDGQVSVPVDNSIRQTYYPTSHYVNASPLDRYGLEWVVDVKAVKSLNTGLRIDGNYYYYKGTDDMLFADIHNANARMSGTNEPYRYVGWYRGTNAYSGVATASVSNGALSRQLNLNATVTTHIPRIRMVVALRIESTLYNYRRSIADYLYPEQHVVYPEYYTTWEAPDRLIPFKEAYQRAKVEDQTLYNDLTNLVLLVPNAYTLNPNRLSAYYSANLSVTKEIGDHVSVSFYANNFFNNMKTVHSSQTDLETSLFASSYIPSYYYGLSLRFKL